MLCVSYLYIKLYYQSKNETLIKYNDLTTSKIFEHMAGDWIENNMSFSKVKWGD